MQLGLGTGAGGDAGPASAAADAATDGGAPQGSACETDPQWQVTLCGAIDLCPEVTVDPGVYPHCGFHMHDGAVFDLECLCGDALCPIGVPASCDDVKKLLDAQSELLVCQQVSEGRCVSLVQQGSSSGSGGGGSATTCDRQCESQCGGDPSCIQICGC
jgi:hypothetical protein